MYSFNNHNIKEDIIKISIVIMIMLITIVSMVQFNLQGKEIIMFIMMIMYLKMVSKKNTKDTLLICIACFLYITICQIVIYFVFTLLNLVNSNNDIGVVINCLLLIITISIYKTNGLNKLLTLYRQFTRIMNIIISMIMIMIISYYILWKINFISSVSPIVIIGILIWSLFTSIIYKELLIIKEKQNANDIYIEYSPILEDLVTEVKAKQHDIKNQLQVIYSVAEKKKDYELIEYIQSLIEGYKLNQKDLFLNTGNNIFNAILYSKKIKANQNNISFNLKYHSPFPYYPIKDYEFVDIIGNLLDNAIEETSNDNYNIKDIQVSFVKENNYNIIRVNNTTSSFNPNNISKLFNKGYSLKGNNRGFGLYNVNQIIKAYNGLIEILYKDNYVVLTIKFLN
jgi:two-component system sensor histidine kinase AgrC